jgi:hypothetical protein
MFIMVESQLLLSYDEKASKLPPSSTVTVCLPRGLLPGSYRSSAADFSPMNTRSVDMGLCEVCFVSYQVIHQDFGEEW